MHQELASERNVVPDTVREIYTGSQALTVLPLSTRPYDEDSKRVQDIPILCPPEPQP